MASRRVSPALEKVCLTEDEYCALTTPHARWYEMSSQDQKDVHARTLLEASRDAAARQALKLACSYRMKRWSLSAVVVGEPKDPSAIRVEIFKLGFAKNKYLLVAADARGASSCELLDDHPKLGLYRGKVCVFGRLLYLVDWSADGSGKIAVNLRRVFVRVSPTCCSTVMFPALSSATTPPTIVALTPDRKITNSFVLRLGDWLADDSNLVTPMPGLDCEFHQLNLNLGMRLWESPTGGSLAVDAADRIWVACGGEFFVFSSDFSSCERFATPFSLGTFPTLFADETGTVRLWNRKGRSIYALPAATPSD